jgi:hypothetical protein
MMTVLCGRLMALLLAMMSTSLMLVWPRLAYLHNKYCPLVVTNPDPADSSDEGYFMPGKGRVCCVCVYVRNMRCGTGCVMVRS